ncbi:hypothetical protein [Deinococcus sp. RM]|uniref:hypothetical protein n=1 Tax=Deinococcus sp. RM TaxID=2316359 RepID=UPI000E681089|nr:hypothetical protein [Deinococcus sp. RM]RIY15688.1 hypothetical protein D3W47_01290 [Deinococcus sp. RM]
MTFNTPLDRFHAAVTAGADLLPGALPMTLDVQGDTLTLRSAAAAETFTLEGQVLRGRGGTFDVLKRPQCALALMTVQPTATHTREHAQLTALATAHGFELRTGRHAEWEHLWTVTPLHLRHPDGRVLWLAEYAANDLFSSSSSVLCAGDHRLAAYHLPLDEDTRILMAMSDAELLTEFGALPTLPETVTASTFGVRPEAFAALLAGEAPAPEHLAPSDFFSHPQRYENPALRVTRASLSARGQAAQATGDRASVG